MTDIGHFGDSVKRLRKQQNMYINETAVQIDVDYSNLSNIEAGRFIPTASAAVAIANYYGVGVHDLIAGLPEEDKLLRMKTVTLLNAFDDDADFEYLLEMLREIKR